MPNYKTTYSTNPGNGGTGAEFDASSCASYQQALDSLRAEFVDIYETSATISRHPGAADQYAAGLAAIEAARRDSSQPELELEIGSMIYRLRK